MMTWADALMIVVAYCSHSWFPDSCRTDRIDCVRKNAAIVETIPAEQRTKSSDADMLSACLSNASAKVIVPAPLPKPVASPAPMASPVAAKK